MTTPPIIVPYIPTPFETYLAMPYRFPLYEDYPVVRIPVAGPAPFNTLVVVRGRVSVARYRASDGKLQRWKVSAGSGFKLRGHDPDSAGPPAFQQSTTGALQLIETTDDSWFCSALLSVRGEFDPSGNWVFHAEIGEAWDGVYAGALAYVSSWVLCYEPRGTAPGVPAAPAGVTYLEQPVGSAGPSFDGPDPSVFTPPTAQTRIERASALGQLVYRHAGKGETEAAQITAGGAIRAYSALLADAATFDTGTRAGFADQLLQLSGYPPAADQPAPAKAAVEFRRGLHEANPTDPAARNQLANALWVLTVRESTDGHQAETHAAATESTALYLQLLADPGPMEPAGFADQLLALSGYLPAADQPAPAQAAVDFRRGLHEANPTDPAAQNQLANALWVLTVRESTAGRQAEMHTAAAESTGLYLQLLGDPGPMKPAGFADQLLALSGYLPAADQPGPAQAAVGFRRGLWEANPTDPAARNQLANALWVLTVRESTAGHQAETHAAAAESTGLYLQLLADPGPIEPAGFADQLLALSGYLPAAAQPAPAQAAVAFRRRHWEANPTDAGARNQLANALWVLTVRESTAAHTDQTFAAAAESTALYLQLLADPGPMEPAGFADQLLALSGYLPAADQPAPAQAAVDFRRERVNLSPGDHSARNQLANALWVLTVRAKAADRVAESQAAAVEATQLYSALLADPGPIDPGGLADQITQLKPYLPPA